MAHKSGGSLRNSLRGYAKKARAGLSEVLEMLNDEDAKRSQFGVSLGEWMNLQKTVCPEYDVPFVIGAILVYLRKYGLKTKGLFRLSGSHEYIQLLRVEADVACEVDFMEGTQEYVHVVGGLLKLYLRDIPGSLMENHLIEDWLACVHKENDTGKMVVDVERTRDVLGRMNEFNVNVLANLLQLCLSIAVHSEENKMTVENLATCLAPSLLFRNTLDIEAKPPMEILAETLSVNHVVQAMMEQMSQFPRIHAVPVFVRPDLPAELRLVYPPERKTANGSMISGSNSVRASPLKRTMSQLLTHSPQALQKHMRKDSKHQKISASERMVDKNTSLSSLQLDSENSENERGPEIHPAKKAKEDGHEPLSGISEAEMEAKYASSRLANSPLMRKRAHTDVRSIFESEMS